MAYQVNKFNGTFLVAVEDGTIDTTTDLRFVGKNYAGYGEVQNENYLHLLENFANTSAPPKVINGQIWYDSGNKKLKFYDGSRFRVAGGAETGSSAPSGLTTGDFWFDTSAKQLYTWTGTDFVLIGPAASPDLGASAVTAQVVKDTLNNNHTIVKLISGGKTIAIVSQDEFTLNSSTNPIEDFSVIKKGITMLKTGTTGVTSDDHYFWGTASNAARLGGVEASNFVQRGSVVFDNEIRFKDAGYQLGDNNDLRVRKEAVDGIVFENRLGNDLTFKITVSESDQRKPLLIRSTGVTPGANLTFDLGSVAAKWNNVYAGTVNGNLVGNVTGNSTGNHTGNVLAADTQVMINATTKEIGYAGATLRGNLFGSVEGNLTGIADDATKLNGITPSISVPSAVDKTSVPIRDSSGNIAAVQFVGTADKSVRMKIDDSATDSDPTYRSAKTTATANTIAARDGSGNLVAVLFDGTATAARYADLAEKYLPDADYEVGTVMVIGGEKEITASTWGQRAIGVISANPAFMMNKDLEGGVYVALKGRVPVKVTGAVKKGDRLVASNQGCAVAGVPHSSDVFAIALESSDDISTKTIEAVIL